jgi:hypothetical protein
MSARTLMRGVAFIGATALLASMVMAPAASAAPLPASTKTTATAAPATAKPKSVEVTSVPETRALTTLYEGGKLVYDKISTCLANKSVGLKCTASDSGNIRAMYKKLDEVDQRIRQNQEVLNSRFNGVEKMLEDIRKELVATKLKALEKNVPLGIWAVEALTECSAKFSEALRTQTPEQARKTATCQPYLGQATGTLEPAENIVEATKKTSEYLTKVVNDTTTGQAATLETLATAFAGTPIGKNENGLAHVIATNLLGEQHRLTGAVKKSAHVKSKTPVVTKWLSDKVNIELEYWNQLLTSFGMLWVVKRGLNNKDVTVAQNEVDREITCIKPSPCQPDSVGAVAKKWSLPNLKEGEFLFVDGTDIAGAGEIWKVSAGPNLKDPLSFYTVQRMALSINKYATMSDVYKFDKDSFASASVLTNRPTYLAEVGLKGGTTGYFRVCINNACLLKTDPQSERAKVINSDRIMTDRCWNPVNIEDTRPAWNSTYYNPNTYREGIFVRTGSEIYAQEVSAPISMPWEKNQVLDSYGGVLGHWGWGMSPACKGGPATSHGSMVLKPASAVPSYVGWK